MWRGRRPLHGGWRSVRRWWAEQQRQQQKQQEQEDGPQKLYQKRVAAATAGNCNCMAATATAAAASYARRMSRRLLERRGVGPDGSARCRYRVAAAAGAAPTAAAATTTTMTRPRATHSMPLFVVVNTTWILLVSCVLAAGRAHTEQKHPPCEHWLYTKGAFAGVRKGNIRYGWNSGRAGK